MSEKHKPPLTCYLRRCVEGASPSVRSVRCLLGLRSGCSKCEDCTANVRDLIAEGFQKGLEDGRTKFLKIAFIGYNTRLTHTHLHQFAIDNAEQVLAFDGKRGHLLLRDFTVVEACPSTKELLHGRHYDQIILADDRRRLTMAKRTDYMAHLVLLCEQSHVPEEYRFQFYDTDADQPRKEANQ